MGVMKNHFTILKIVWQILTHWFSIKQHDHVVKRRLIEEEGYKFRDCLWGGGNEEPFY